MKMKFWIILFFSSVILQPSPLLSQTNNWSNSQKIDTALAKQLDFYVEVPTGTFGQDLLCYALDSTMRSSENSIQGNLVKSQCFINDSSEYIKIRVKEYSVIEGNRIRINNSQVKEINLNVEYIEVKTAFENEKHHNYSFNQNDPCDLIRLNTGEIINVQVQSVRSQYLSYSWCCSGCTTHHSISSKSIDSIAFGTHSSELSSFNLKYFLANMDKKPMSSVKSNLDTTFLSNEKLELENDIIRLRKISKGLAISGGIIYAAVLIGYPISNDPLYWDYSVFAGGPSGTGLPLLGIVVGTGLMVGALIVNSKSNRYRIELFNWNKNY